MTRITTLKIRLSAALKEFVAGHVGDAGPYESASEYVRDLIRRDKERVEGEKFECLRDELQHAFGKPEASYKALTAAEVIARNRAVTPEGSGPPRRSLTRRKSAAKRGEIRFFAVFSASGIRPRCGSPREFVSRFTPSAI